MAYEAEIMTDRTARRKSKVTRLGSVVMSVLRSNQEHMTFRTEVLTEFRGRLLTVSIRRFDGDALIAKQQVTLLDNADINEVLNGTQRIRRTANGAVAPPLLPGEPDLLD